MREYRMYGELGHQHSCFLVHYSIRSSDVLNSLEWSNLEERRKRHLLVTMFKVFNNNCPTYLLERFHRTSEIDWGVLTMICNYHVHYLKQIFLSVHFLIGMQWLGTNCQIKHVRWGILLSLNSRYPRIQLINKFLSYFFNDSFLAVILYFKLSLFFYYYY